MDQRAVIAVIDPDEQTRAVARAAADARGYDLVAFDDGVGLIERLANRRPVLVIAEVELAGAMNGLEVLSEIHSTYGDEVPVILVSAGRTAPLDRVAGLLLGADDYVLKPFDASELRARVRRSLQRACPAHGPPPAAAEGPTLSPRERQVLARLAAGQTQEQIAAELFISPKTVATHIQHLLVKLDVHSRAQAVAVAYRRGMMASDDAAV